MNTIRTKLPCLAALLALGTAAAAAQPPQIQRPRPQPIPRGGVTPTLHLQADLVIQSMGFSHEFCLLQCSDQWSRELQVSRIQIEGCAWKVAVRNRGNARSRPGTVRLQYQSIDGPVVQQAPLPAIAPGHVANVVVPFNNARIRNPYWRFGTPFRATADATNTTPESDESNNSASLTPQP